MSAYAATDVLSWLPDVSLARDTGRGVRVEQGAAEPRTWDADTAVTVLYGSHWSPMVRLATVLTGDASVAEEIVQDSFVALHARWRSLKDPRTAGGYLRTSVVNGARSALRHRTVQIRHRQPGAPEPSGPEELAVRADQDATVMAALRRLPRRQQEVLVLRYYSDLSEAEIAQALGISRGAVKSHAHRGLAALRTDLETDPSLSRPSTTQEDM